MLYPALFTLLLAGLAWAQGVAQATPEKLHKAYRYELIVGPLEEMKLPPPPPEAGRVRQAFVEKQGILDLRPSMSADGRVVPSTFLLSTEGPLPHSDIQEVLEVLKTIGLRATRIHLVSSPEKPQKD
jgi:hypothetical protein